MGRPTDAVELLITYRLRDDVSIEEFRRWSRDVDQPAVKRLSGIRRYDIYEVASVEEGGEHPDIVDVVEAKTWEDWLAVDSDPTMREIADDFFSRICAPDSIQTLRVRRI